MKSIAQLGLKECTTYDRLSNFLLEDPPRILPETFFNVTCKTVDSVPFKFPVPAQALIHQLNFSQSCIYSG